MGQTMEGYGTRHGYLAMFMNVYDIDGTLTVPGGAWPRPHSTKDVEYAKLIMDPCRIAQDKPTRLAKHIEGLPLAERHLRILLTGRAEWSRHITEAWMAAHEITYNSLLMRPTADCREAFYIKFDYLRGLALLDGSWYKWVINDKVSAMVYLIRNNW